MAEAVRRFREASGSDVVRRLIARPIRLDPPRMPARMPFTIPSSERTEDPSDALADTASEIAAVESAGIEEETFEDESEELDIVGRLQTEMAVMKAVLMAERAEAAALRARLAQHFEPEPIGAEARATRERWAGMVDRLLLFPR